MGREQTNQPQAPMDQQTLQPTPKINVAQLAELVYRLMAEDLRLEQARLGRDGRRQER
jgi:hypothetical protein